jgi:hypothetical protein
MMTDEENRVLKLVQCAFRDINLGDGVGLWQAQGIDDYADAQTLDNYRAQDEKTDWSAIPVDHLDQCHSSLCFFDDEGMRFHLPAYLCADLQGALNTANIIFHLTRGMSAFDMLSRAQRNAVREFLLLRLSDCDYEFERKDIEFALREYWKPT